ncbi:glycosyl transferase [Fervidicella metallireducens AeB]|uniref:Glycosyl transferase n=2 Tax=Fervidicella TaxID=1403538 RepID=A0A017RXZ6_9CLOT|nr:glycosyl transferase [Fervidicella metallireducens AeB]
MFLYSIYQYLSYFVFVYPLIMSIVWIVGGIYFWSNFENKAPLNLNEIKDWPPVTILVPCHNEEAVIRKTCERLRYLNYLDYQVIFIDDASSDATSNIISEFIGDIAYFHLLSLKKNLGKAGALNKALSYVNTPFVLVLDADTILLNLSLKWLVAPFYFNTKLAAVTGNPLPLNRSNLLSKFQTAEFMSIIGLIKRCQSFWGKIFTVSGCITLYSTSALKNVGGFSSYTATEDIDVSWKLQRLSYEIWFQPEAIAYIQVPTKFKEYIKQRKRWALGGWHLLRTHKSVFTEKENKKLWTIYLETVAAYLWAFCFVIVFSIDIILFVIRNHNPVNLFGWTASILCFICVLQMLIAIFINLRYDKSLIKSIFWIPWYPLIFFSVGAFLVVSTFIKGLFGSLENSGKWNSPERDVNK